MKLGEALFRSEQIEERLKELDILLTHVSREKIKPCIEEADELIREQHQLKMLILETSLSTAYPDGSTLYDARKISKVLETKRNLYTLVNSRTDLTASQRASIVDYYNDLSKKKQALDTELTKLIWQTELIKYK